MKKEVCVDVCFCLQVDSKAAFWDWIEEEFIPGIYDTSWYNGQQFIAPEGYISTREAFLVGMPRLKQVRVKGGEIKFQRISKSIHRSIDQSVSQSINRSTDQSINQAINQSIRQVDWRTVQVNVTLSCLVLSHNFQLYHWAH